MSVGLQPTKIEIDSLVGNITKILGSTLRQGAAFKAYLDTQTDTQLTALGYTSGDVAVLRSAFTDLNTLNNAFAGSVTVSPAYDFRTFIKLLWGLGGAYQ